MKCRGIAQALSAVLLFVWLAVPVHAVMPEIPIEEPLDQIELMSNDDEMTFQEDTLILRMKSQAAQPMSLKSSAAAPDDFSSVFGIPLRNVEVLEEAASSQLRSFGASSQGALLLLELQQPGKEQVESAIKQLRENPAVESVQPNYLYKADDILPNDPEFDSLYAMQQIGAPQAWETTTGSDVVVAVLDSGIDLDHEDLKDNLWVNEEEIAGDGIDNDGNGKIDDIHGWNFVSNNNDVNDDYFHGTHVSGTIGARGNNGIGVAGVAWNVKIMALKVLNSSGYGTTASMVSAINYAKQKNVKILNNSYGMYAYDHVFDETVKNCGALFVASAGNDGIDTDIRPHYPSCFTGDNVISVAASDANGNLAYFSNYGRVTVDISAPGSSILSTYPGDLYQKFSGTSMAAPHVSGAAALLLSAEPDLSAVQLKERLRNQVHVLPQYENKTVSEGGLNIQKALQNDELVLPVSVALSASSVTLMVREMTQVFPTVSPALSNQKDMIYASSDKSVAEVNEFGEIRGVGEGMAVVTATLAANPSALATVAVTVSGSAQPVLFPDQNMKGAVRRSLASMSMREPNTTNPYVFYKETDPLYPDDLFLLAKLNASGMNISDMTGLSYIPRLIALDCSNNQLESLDVTGLPLLRSFNCSSNRLVDISFLPNNHWIEFYCYHNYLNVAEGSALKTDLDTVSTIAKKIRYLPQTEFVTPQTISIALKTSEMKLRETQLLDAVVLPEAENVRDVLWSSSDSAVLSVSSDGAVTAKSSGTAVVTAALSNDQEVSAQVTIHVSDESVQPIAFRNRKFKSEVVEHLKRANGTYASYTVDSDVYPDDMLAITSFITKASDIDAMAEIGYAYGLTSLSLNAVYPYALDLSMLPALERLSIENAMIRRVDIGGLKKLKSITITGSMLHDLNLSGNYSLETLNVANNRLQCLSGSGLSRLKDVVVQNNELTYLDLSEFPGIETLDCSNNRIFDLDASDAQFLTKLICDSNKMTHLDFSEGSVLKYMTCEKNYLDVSKGSEFRQKLERSMNQFTEKLAFESQLAIPGGDTVKLTASSFFLEDGERAAISVDGTMADKTFTSSNPAIASVDELGRMTPHSSGDVVVTAADQNHPDRFAQANVRVRYTAQDGDGTAENPFRLRNKQDMFWLSAHTTNASFKETRRYLKAHYSLEPENGAFIDLENEPFEPIGFDVLPVAQSGFGGVFEGNGKEIRNLKIEKTHKANLLLPGATKAEGVGLFAYVLYGTIWNLQITNADVSADHPGGSDGYDVKDAGLAALAGYLWMSTVDNVSATGVVTAGSHVDVTGGLIGYSDASSVTNSAADVEVNGNNFTGGFAGKGIAGNGCFARGDVYGQDRTGGFIGYSEGVAGCYSTGDVHGHDSVGGFAGYSGDVGNGIPVTNCYSVGNVWGNNDVGGFIGLLNSCGVSSCYSVGNVWGNARVGGFAGSEDLWEGIRYCYALGSVSGQGETGGFVGVSFTGSSVYQNYAGGLQVAGNPCGSFVGAITDPEFDYEYFEVNTMRYYEAMTISPGGNTLGKAVSKQELEDGVLGDTLRQGYDLSDKDHYPHLYTKDGTALLENQPAIPLGGQLLTEVTAVFDSSGFQVGDVRDILVTSTPEQPFEVACSYTSSDPAVVQVGPDGAVSALSPGAAVVTVVPLANPALTKQITIPVLENTSEFSLSAKVSQNGSAVNEITRGLDVTVELSAYLPVGESSQPMEYFAVLYDKSGRFVSRIPLISETVQAGGHKFQPTVIPAEQLASAGSLSFFKWESLNSVKPLARQTVYLVK